MADKKDTTVKVSYLIVGMSEDNILLATDNLDTLAEYVRWMKSNRYAFNKVIKRTTIDEEIPDWK